MNELIEELKARPELMEKMGLTFLNHKAGLIARIDGIMFSFDVDENLGSALFCVRGLKVLRERASWTVSLESVPSFTPEEGELWCCRIAEPAPIAKCAPTMSQAVGEALIEVFKP